MANDSVSGDFTWNVDMEVNLFHAMRGHKPAGVNRHFHMISIYERLSSASKKITPGDIWTHLSTLYDLQALNESEIVPFPNKKTDFGLPDSDVSSLCEQAFPRTPYISAQPEPKPESVPKNTPKTGKQDKDSKTQQTPTPKPENREAKLTESKSSGSSKSSDRSSSSHKHSHSSSQHQSPSTTPRTKRTRTTPNEAPSKRRR